MEQDVCQNFISKIKDTNKLKNQLKTKFSFCAQIYAQVHCRKILLFLHDWTQGQEKIEPD